MMGPHDLIVGIAIIAWSLLAGIVAEPIMGRWAQRRP